MSGAESEELVWVWELVKYQAQLKKIFCYVPGIVVNQPCHSNGDNNLNFLLIN